MDNKQVVDSSSEMTQEEIQIRKAALEKELEAINIRLAEARMKNSDLNWLNEVKKRVDVRVEETVRMDEQKIKDAVEQAVPRQNFKDAPDELKTKWEQEMLRVEKQCKNLEVPELSKEQSFHAVNISASEQRLDEAPSQFEQIWMGDTSDSLEKEFTNALKYPNAAMNFIYKNPDNIALFPAEKQTNTLVTLAIVCKPSTLMHIKDEEMRRSKYQLAVSRDGMQLENIPSAEQNVEIGFAAVNNNPDAVQFLREDLKNPVLDLISEKNDDRATIALGMRG